MFDLDQLLLLLLLLRLLRLLLRLLRLLLVVLKGHLMLLIVELLLLFLVQIQVIGSQLRHLLIMLGAHRHTKAPPRDAVSRRQFFFFFCWYKIVHNTNNECLLMNE